MATKLPPTGVNAEIRAGMARHGLRQTDMAAMLSLSQASIADRLGGRFEWRLSELRAVALRIGVPLVDLVAAWEADASGAPDPDVEPDVDAAPTAEAVSA